MILPPFWELMGVLNGTPTAIDVFSVMISTYATISLIEAEKYGPYDILRVYEETFKLVFGDDYCIVCMSFWVALSMAFLVPYVIVLGLCAVGFVIIVRNLQE